MDVQTGVTELFAGRSDVEGVELIGSRARGEATALSDWDFRIHTTDTSSLAHDLPTMVTPLEPLAAQWDRLAEHAVYMLIIPGAVKIDLFPGDQRHEIEPPWAPTAGNLAAVDAHFWDWILWLGSKALAQRRDIVRQELAKLHRNLLGPLGVPSAATTIGAAVSDYRDARDRLERQWQITVARRLDDDVSAALTREGVM